MNENIANKFDKDLQFVMICLQEVLQELHHDELLACIPWLPHQQSPSLSKVQSPFRLVQLLSISFQLLGMIEENINVQERREQQADGRLEREYGLWPWALETLQKEGYSEATVLQTIQGLQVEPVLTAHPTESKRATVLEHHRDLYLQLVKLENQMWTPVERQWLKDDIKASLERLWRTGEIYRQRPDLKLELRNTLHYLRNIFPALLPWLDHRFETAWQQAGSLLPLNFMQDHYPRFSLGNWVGGDRDGHPLVSAEITQSALLDLRLNALIVLRHQLTELSKKLSLSDQVQKAPEILCDRLAACAQLFPSAYQTALQKHDGESWRVLICIMIERLPIEVVRDHATQLDDRAYCYKNPQELMQDFAVLHEGLLSISAHRLVQTELKNAVRTLQCLGFHSAVLDIRQNSQFHDEALSQLLVFAGVEGAHDYPNWTPLEKSALIHKELELLRPFTMPGQNLSGQAKAVMSCYEVLRDYSEKYGFSGLGSLIVSMTHSAEDLFSVYLLMREAGLASLDDQTLMCPIQVVPLFETIEDLQNSAAILTNFLAHPITRRSLQVQANRQGLRRPRQQVMIGYSDSCKDGGILASQWHLYLAQQEMHKVGQEHGIEICFFHGRGGTVSRGAGPVHRFLQALPRGALNGAFRLTEQGETIALKYANQATAVYNLELMLASVTAETLRSQHKPDEDPFFLELMRDLAQKSRETYHALISREDFLHFFRQATPIDALEHSRIGSRPPKRSGQPSLEDLRAIPWVFAWNQARFYLPSWYGVGTALHELKKNRPHDFDRLVKNRSHYTLLNYILYNVETTVASASESIMQDYASLIEDEGLRKSYMDDITNEFRLTREMLIAVFGTTIEQRRPHVVKTILLRESSLGILHQLQIQQLRQWRALAHGHPDRGPLLEALLLTINAIAGGLRNTG